VKMYLLERRRWRRCRRDSSTAIRVYHGYDRIPLPGEPASGGIIKCQDLQRIFPNDPLKSNLLYLVSSVLPPHLPVLLSAARRAGAPVVLNQNGVAYQGWHGPGWEESNVPLTMAHNAADYIFYQSEFCRVGAQRFLGKPVGKGEILYNAVDTTVFTPIESKSGHAGPVLLLAGSHHFFYRVQTAVDTLACLRESWPAARLIMAGRFRWGSPEESALAEIKAYVHEQGLDDRVEWVGAYSQTEAPALLRRADILLHTKYNDPCPRLVLEAMACGLPVVYSATGGMPELVGEDAGVGVPGPLDWEQDHPPAPDLLSEGVRRVLSDYSRYSRGARERAVSRFDVVPWLDRHRIVFEMLLR